MIISGLQQVPPRCSDGQAFRYREYAEIPVFHPFFCNHLACGACTSGRVCLNLRAIRAAEYPFSKRVFLKALIARQLFNIQMAERLPVRLANQLTTTISAMYRGTGLNKPVFQLINAARAPSAAGSWPAVADRFASRHFMKHHGNDCQINAVINSKPGLPYQLAASGSPALCRSPFLVTYNRRGIVDPLYLRLWPAPFQRKVVFKATIESEIRRRKRTSSISSAN